MQIKKTINNTEQIKNSKENDRQKQFATKSKLISLRLFVRNWIYSKKGLLLNGTTRNNWNLSQKRTRIQSLNMKSKINENKKSMSLLQLKSKNLKINSSNKEMPSLKYTKSQSVKCSNQERQLKRRRLVQVCLDFVVYFRRIARQELYDQDLTLFIIKRMKIFNNTALFILLALILQASSQKINETVTAISKQREVCLSHYEKYVEVLKEIYIGQLEEMNQTYSQSFFIRKIAQIVRKCYTLTSEQIQNYYETISKQTATSLQQFLAVQPEILSNVRQQAVILEEIKLKRAQIEVETADGIVMFGYNLKKLPKSFKYYYLAVYTAIAIGALIYGLKDMENRQQVTKRD